MVELDTDLRDVCHRPHELNKIWELDCIAAVAWTGAIILVVFMFARWF